MSTIDENRMMDRSLYLAQKYGEYATDIQEIANKLIQDTEESLCWRHIGPSEKIIINKIYEISAILKMQGDAIYAFSKRMEYTHEAYLELRDAERIEDANIWEQNK